MPTTSTPALAACVVAAAMTLLIPGAGPPPTTIPSLPEPLEVAIRRS
jgi:hypothetical protein